jgi:hypothetical protein
MAGRSGDECVTGTVSVNPPYEPELFQHFQCAIGRYQSESRVMPPRQFV